MNYHSSLTNVRWTVRRHTKMFLPMILRRVIGEAEQDRRPDVARPEQSGISGIVIVSPGGSAGGGGMGTVTGQIAAWCRLQDPVIPVRVIDTRGSGSILISPFLTLYGLWSVVLEASRGSNILHLNVAERTSFVRKRLFAALGHMIGMSVILHHHGAEMIVGFPTAARPLRRIMRKTVAAAHLNIVLGTLCRDFLIAELDAPRNSVVILPNATPDIRPLVRARRAAMEPGIRPFSILLLANLNPRKGISELLQALVQLRTAGLEIRATLAGGGMVDSYRAEVRQRNLDGLVFLVGWMDRDAVPGLLAESDLLVLPSYQEGLPMAIIEALCAEVPVVTTPVGAIPDFMIGDHHCAFVPPGDVKRLASAIRELCEHPPLRTRFASAGRALYEREFTIDKYMSRLFGLYTIAIETATSPPRSGGTAAVGQIAR
jgi:glycosyltransferase involved in cell wall biosynthesis